MFHPTAMFVNRQQATYNERTAVQATRICATAHGKPQHQWLAPCCETDSVLVPVGSVDPAGPPPSWVVPTSNTKEKLTRSHRDQF